MIANRQLRGWKEIAAWLGRDESTVKRWAASRGLPVHRVPGRGRASVYAWSEDIACWLTGQNRPRDGETSPDDIPIAVAPAGRRFGKKAVAALAICLALAVAVPATLAVLGNSPVTSVVSANVYRSSDTAQGLYLNGTYLYQKRTPGSLKLAASDLERAVDLDPKFAAAHAALAITYDLMVEYRLIDPADGYDRAQAAARTALALDPARAEAHAVLGDIAFFRARDYETGLDHFRRSIGIDPANALARHWYASALLCAGRYREALVEIGEAQRLDPASRSILVSKSMILLAAGDVAGAEALLGNLALNEPGYRNPYRFLSFAALARGDHQAYLAALRKRFELAEDPAGLRIVATGEQAYGRGGAAAMVEEMATAAVGERGAVEPYFLAHILSLAGDFDGAATELALTSTRHAFYYGFDPAFAGARDTPSFLRRIRDAGLPVIR